MTNFDFLLDYSEFSVFATLANEAEKQYNKSTMSGQTHYRFCKA